MINIIKNRFFSLAPQLQNNQINSPIPKVNVYYNIGIIDSWIMLLVALLLFVFFLFIYVFILRGINCEKNAEKFITKSLVNCAKKQEAFKDINFADMVDMTIDSFLEICYQYEINPRGEEGEELVRCLYSGILFEALFVIIIASLLSIIPLYLYHKWASNGKKIKFSSTAKLFIFVVLGIKFCIITIGWICIYITLMRDLKQAKREILKG